MATCKNNRKALYAIFASITVSIIFAQNIFATGWGGGNNTGGGGSCGDSSASGWFDTCFGGAWEYYTYKDGFSGDVYTYSRGSVDGMKIPSTCAEVGGFYNFGLIPYNPSKKGVANRIEKGYNGNFPNKQQIGSARKIGSTTVNMLKYSDIKGITPKSKARKNKSWKKDNISSSEVGAVSQYYADPDVVLQHFNIAKAAGVIASNINTSNVTAFCYGPGLNKKTSTFDSSSKVVVKDTTTGSSWSGWDSSTTAAGVYETNSASVTLTFDHKLRRNADDNNKGEEVSIGWSISGDYTKTGTTTWATNVTGEKTSVGTQDVSVSLNFNEEKTVCATITHPSKIEGGSTSGSETSSACMKVKRKPARSSTFDSASKVTVKDTTTSSGWSGWDSSVTAAGVYEVTDPSVTLTFDHKLRRNADDANKNVSVSLSWSVSGDYTDSGTTTWDANVTGEKTSIGTKDVAVSLTPGQEKTVCATITHSSTVTEVAASGSETSSACIKVKRKNRYGEFSGAVNVYVNDTQKSIDSDNEIIPITTDGYRVRFDHNLTRVAGDTAGFIVTEKYYTTVINDKIQYDLGSGTAYGSGTDLKTWSSTDAATATVHQNEFIGKIYPGQTVKYCQTIYYYQYAYESGDVSTIRNASRCVTLTRADGLCALENYKWTIYGGYNIGRSGVEKNDGAFGYTSVDRSKFTSSNNYTNVASIWAKPNDSIRFRHEMCAGAQYAVAKNSISGKDASYTISGSSAYGNTGYLFGNSLSADKNTTSKTFSVGNADSNGGFLKTSFSLARQSPSDDAGSKYNCSAATSSSFKTNHYHVPGLSSTNNCASATYTRASDVGNTITQTMSWNDVEVIGSRDVTPYVSSSHNGVIFTAKANAYIPYNYIAIPYVTKSGNNQTVSPGGSLAVNTYVAVGTRDNKQVGGSAYATHTKATKIRIVSFTLHSGLPANSSTTHAGANNVSASTLCSYAVASGSVVSCNEISTNLGNNDYILNSSATGQLEGTASDTSSIKDNSTKIGSLMYAKGGSFVTSVSVAVPENNIYIGDKICVAIATWPSDSHNIGFNKTVDSTNQGAALTSAAGTGAMWGVSAPNCVTIAKKPTFSVEGSQLVSAKDVKTSRSKYGGRYYDSWSEYGLLSGGTVKNMASGAASAYISAQSLITNSTVSYASYLNNVNMPTTSAGTKVGSSACLYTAQTYLSGGDCAKPGNASSVATANNINDILTRVRDVYTRKANTTYHAEAGLDDFTKLDGIYDGTNYVKTKMTIGSKNYYDVTPGTGYACLYDEELGFYVPHANDANKGLRIDGRSTAPYYCLSNGAKYRYVNGNAYLGSRNDNYNQLFLFVDDLTNEEGQETYRNQTQIYHIKGDLIIDTNLIVGRNYNPGSGNILADIFDDIQQIPQVIIMADRIYVSSRVTRIDAWLIADGAHGTINTCAYDGYSGFTGGQYIKDPGSHSILNAKICDRSILFNGPVFAKNMVLNRTAGAGTQTLGANQYWGYGMPNLYIDGSSYSQRGEIFNLRSDAYLWGYYQAQRSGILTTVFTHELPTRY